MKKTSSLFGPASSLLCMVHLESQLEGVSPAPGERKDIPLFKHLKGNLVTGPGIKTGYLGYLLGKKHCGRE